MVICVSRMSGADCTFGRELTHGLSTRDQYIYVPRKYDPIAGAAAVAAG